MTPPTWRRAIRAFVMVVAAAALYAGVVGAIFVAAPTLTAQDVLVEVPYAVGFLLAIAAIALTRDLTRLWEGALVALACNAAGLVACVLASVVSPFIVIVGVVTFAIAIVPSIVVALVYVGVGRRLAERRV